MAIRERLRKTFKRKKDSSSSGGSTPSSGSDPSHYTGRTDIEYYKPHEIPKSKYKGKVDPQHRERLESYSFADAFSTVRRKSSQALSGVMSPGGTKSQSRRPSYMSHMSKASRDDRKSVLITPGPHDGHNVLSRQGTASEKPPAPLIRENSEDDTDVLNGEVDSSCVLTCANYLAAGLSRRGTAKPETATAQSNVPEVRLERQATVPDQPFTAEQLEQAMTAATLRGNDNGTLHNSLAVAAH